MFRPVDPKLSSPKSSINTLNTGNEEFLKSVEQKKENPSSFFDGPPFANGLPHYGHILAQSLKDAVTRYFTMRLLCPSCERLGLSWASRGIRN